MTTNTIPAESLRPGDTIPPPERELRLWMRRRAAERGLSEEALLLTVVSVQEGAPDKGGRWLVVTGRETEAWRAGKADFPFRFKVRPMTPWRCVRPDQEVA